jgi:L-aspartate oxidase
MIAASCLAREESRGAHQRADHPATDRALDHRHTLVEGGAEPRFELWT